MLIDVITETIGNTPLLKLNNIIKHFNLSNNIYAKLEYFNPGCSIKDRAAYNMLLNSNLCSGGTVIEATSGNTGIGLAVACQHFKYKLIIVMPENLSDERKMIIKALGANLILTDKTKGIEGAIFKAKKLNSEISNSLYVNQFENEYNWKAHYNSTGPEIYNDLNGKIDYFVSPVGSGGTLTGCGKYFKQLNSNIQIIAIEPYESSVISGYEKNKHGIQGIGAGFIPKILDTQLIDNIIRVKTEQAYENASILSKYEGLLVGLSSGAALSGALILDKTIKNKNIVIMIPDNSERYISVNIYK